MIKMSWLLTVAGVILAFLAPMFVEVVGRRPWPISIKRAVAVMLVVPFVAVLTHAIVTPWQGGALEILGKGILMLWLTLTLSSTWRNWPRVGGRADAIRLVPTNEVRVLLDIAIADAESKLGLTAMRRLQIADPSEGLHGYHLIEYTDGTWLEWLNPTTKKGMPDFSIYSVQSNNKALVRLLTKSLEPHCNVEWAARPLWPQTAQPDR